MWNDEQSYWCRLILLFVMPKRKYWFHLKHHTLLVYYMNSLEKKIIFRYTAQWLLNSMLNAFNVQKVKTMIISFDFKGIQLKIVLRHRIQISPIQLQCVTCDLRDLKMVRDADASTFFEEICFSNQFCIHRTFWFTCFVIDFIIIIVSSAFSLQPSVSLSPVFTLPMRLIFRWKDTQVASNSMLSIFHFVSFWRFNFRSSWSSLTHL